MIKRNTWIMLGVLALLLLVTFVLQQSDDAARPPVEAATVETPPLLLEIETDLISRVKITNLDGQSVIMERQAAGWSLASPEADPAQVDQSRVDLLLAQLAALPLQTEGRINASNSALQLEHAPYTLTLETMDGRSFAVKIGDISPTGSGYYVLLEDQVPRLVSKNPIDQAIGLLNAPPLLPTPVIPEESPVP